MSRKYEGLLTETRGLRSDLINAQQQLETKDREVELANEELR